MKDHLTDWIYNRYIYRVDIDPIWRDMREYVTEEIYFDRDALISFVDEVLDRFVDWRELERFRPHE